MSDPAAPAALPPLVSATVERWPAKETTQDQVAAEVPVSLVFNGIAHAVMMATPQDLESFALGFALSEGILDSPVDCYGVEVETVQTLAVPCAAVQMEISARCFARLKERRRSLVGATGCGLCGVESLDALDLLLPPMAPQAWLAQLPTGVLLAALAAMPQRQVLNAACGALHAAGWVRADGVLTDVLEDVGRHNALDKLLGHLARADRLHEPGLVVMTSRASYELVRKCARLHIPALATISAPTALAIQVAQAAGLTLWGLCRGEQAVRYCP
ncbi:formate dehydrogenase accessory sulfurtransferase FdhD [Acidovorax sp.]|uniref:formate dehydrogenase accessory sulfurtransferase FdhD n=1 Tax=Acidovorax sp. TaxID=1872122 RepID=UPI002ACE4262|nr:formate dehydrogenase accessory sulfurtransferase FdhD [Acidovorax sp.]MDZ7862260.1 formate dehydrogenase accessory sulfurtransferase FdhD [Acidovorax sp.]